MTIPRLRINLPAGWSLLKRIKGRRLKILVSLLHHEADQLTFTAYDGHGHLLGPGGSSDQSPARRPENPPWRRHRRKRGGQDHRPGLIQSKLKSADEKGADKKKKPTLHTGDSILTRRRISMWVAFSQ